MTILFLSVLELSLHIMVGPSHQILKLISFLFESDFSCFVNIDKVIDSNGENIQFFDLVLEHIL